MVGLHVGLIPELGMLRRIPLGRRLPGLVSVWVRGGICFAWGCFGFMKNVNFGTPIPSIDAAIQQKT